MESPKLVYKSSIDSASDIKNDTKIIIPYFTYSNSRMVISPKFAGFQKGHSVSDKCKKNLEKKKLTGTISKSTSRKIENQLTTWLSSIQAYNAKPVSGDTRKQHYPVFVTLTLSAAQSHDDNYIKRYMLGQFIVNLKRIYGVKYYFWRAESQKNGNIHFHLLIDKYVDYSSLMAGWNSILAKYGYIQRFKNVHNHVNPNSVDVRSARNLKNFIEYSLKYMVKDEKYRKINGRLWGMSDELRELKVYSDVIDNQVYMALNEALENENITVYADEFFTIIDFDQEFKTTRLFKILDKRVDNYYMCVYNALYLSNSIAVQAIIPENIEKKRYVKQTQLHFSHNL